MTSQAEVFCRDRRLYDVKRGVVYLRRTDDLAQRQWRHYGTVPAIKTHVIRDVGVTTRLSDVTGSPYDASDDQTLTDGGSENDVRGVEGDVKGSGSDVEAENAAGEKRNSRRKKFDYKTTVLEEPGSARPQISITEVTDRNPSVSPNPTTKSGVLNNPDQNAVPVSSSPPGDLANTSVVSTAASASFTPRGTMSMSWTDSGVLHSDPREMRGSYPHPLSTSKDLQHTLRESPHRQHHYHHPEGSSSSPFNTWGSRDWEVERKLEPDPHPKSHAPKRYPPMSRAAGLGAGFGKRGAGRRQLKTLTDFRSRNGTVRVIRPAAPLAGVEVRSSHAKHHRDDNEYDDDDDDDDDDFDMSALQREKTYAMLKRIDRLLEPTKAFFTSDPDPSEHQVSSSPSDPSTPELVESILSDDDDEHLGVSSTSRGKPQLHSQTVRLSDDRVYVHNEEFLKRLNDDLRDDRSFNLALRDGHEFHGDPSGRRGARGGSYVAAHTPPRSKPVRGHSEPPLRGSVDHSQDRVGESDIGHVRQDRQEHNPRLNWQIREFYHGQPGHPGKRQKGVHHQEQAHDGVSSKDLTTERHERYLQEPNRGNRAFEVRDSYGHRQRPDPHHRIRAIPRVQQQSQISNLQPRAQDEVHPPYSHRKKVHSHHHPHMLLHEAHVHRKAGRPGGHHGCVGLGGQGRGWVGGGSLSAVVERLEKGGVDLYLKCQDWVTRNFSHQTRPTA